MHVDSLKIIPSSYMFLYYRGSMDYEGTYPVTIDESVDSEF